MFIVDPSLVTLGAAAKQKKRKAEAAENNNDKKSRNGERDRTVSETKVEVDGLIETHVTLSPKTPPGDPPEPEELIKVRLLYTCLLPWGYY